MQPTMIRLLDVQPRVLFLLVAAFSAWLCAVLPVFSQEAYYWLYAQHPDFSYFDHPPLVAWSIWLGTHAFGDCTIGVRAATWAWGLGTTALGMLLAREFGLGRKGQNLWILASLASPILAMTHFLANPDAPLVCCWTAVMVALWRARSGAFGWWVVAGIAAGAALLAKYSAAFLAIGGMALLLADAPLRRQLRTPKPWLAVMIAAVVFLPVVAWNLHHDFESFGFQTTGRYAKGHLGVHWLAEFAGEQFLVVHPVLAIAMVAAVFWLVRRWRGDPRARFVLAFGVPLPAWFLANSLFIQVKLNWLAPAIVPLTLGAIVWWCERGIASVQPKVARAATWSFLLVPITAVIAPVLTLLPARAGTSWTGWEEIAARAEAWEDRLDPVDGVEGNFFYFAADYRDAAQLARNLLVLRRGENPAEHPGASSVDFEPTLAQNVFGQSALQFDHWASPGHRIGQDALFVLPRAHLREAVLPRVMPHFESVALAEHVAVRRLGIEVFDADIYVCRGYRGPIAAR